MSKLQFWNYCVHDKDSMLFKGMGSDFSSGLSWCISRILSNTNLHPWWLVRVCRNNQKSFKLRYLYQYSYDNTWLFWHVYSYTWLFWHIYLLHFYAFPILRYPFISRPWARTNWPKSEWNSRGGGGECGWGLVGMSSVKKYPSFFFPWEWSFTRYSRYLFMLTELFFFLFFFHTTLMTIIISYIRIISIFFQPTPLRFLLM